MTSNPVLNDLEYRKFKKEDDGSFEGKVLISDAESAREIASGRVTGKSSVNKFGSAPDFDSADSWTTMWDGADDSGIDEMQYNYSSSAAIDSLSSDAADTVDIEVQGLDDNYEFVVQTITLTGLTRVALTTALRRVFRLKNVDSVDLTGNVYCFENTADTTPADGVPDDTTKIRAMIHVGNNQTLMAVYTVPAGKTAYLENWFASLSGIVPSGVNVRVKIFVRPFGQVFQVKHESALADDGTSHSQHIWCIPEVVTEKSDIEIKVLSDDLVTSVAGGFDIVLEDN